MTGQTISHYRVMQRLGVGGMGEVYLAEDTRLGRKLALKILPAQFTQDPERVRRFEQEARAASALNHPNILTIYEIGKLDEAHFIATEYVEGQTLRQLLQGPLPLADALELVIQAASALQAAHQAGIVHRDIKPENIMQRPDGYVKLLDFGLAKLTQVEAATKALDDDDETATRALLQTQPGLVMGTIAYMSPEQARGQHVDGRTDLFSLGVVLYEMVCGQRPFNGTTHSDVIASLLREEPARISQHLADAPVELEQVLQKLLAKDRAARYATAQELIADLKRIKARLEVADDESVTRTLTNGGNPPISYETNVAQAATFATNVTPAVALGTAANAPVALTGATTAAQLAAKPVISLKALAFAVGAVVLVVGGLFGAFFYNARQRTIDTIAVLPFYTTENKLAPLTDGLTEEAINSVSNLPDLSVIARNSVVKYNARETDVATIGEELNVQAVLTGEISQLGNNAVVQIELTDAKTRRRIWGKSFNRKLNELYELQSDIAAGLAQKLNLTLNADATQRVAQQETKNGEAYRLYLEGRYYYNQGTPAAMHKADQLFEQAVGLDGTYAAAAAGCAACHAYGADQQPPNEVMPKARTVANLALKGDPQSADAHLTLARVALRYDWDFKEAERLINRAIQLEPKNPAPYQRYAEFLALMGRHPEAATAIYQARKLDPRSLQINADIGTLSYFAADYAHAFEHFQKALKLDQDFADAHTGLGLTYEQQNRSAEAINEFLQARMLLRAEPAYVAGLQNAFAKQGAKGFWQQELAHLQTEAKAHYIPATSLAALHARLGEVEQAFKALQTGLKEKDGGLIDLNVTPVFAALRQDARFGELLAQIGLAKVQLKP